MSTKIPQDDPDWIQRAKIVEDLRRRYYDALRAGDPTLAEAVNELTGSYRKPEIQAERNRNQSFPEWVTTALQGATLVTIVGCAFWLGSLSSIVAGTSQKLDKLNDAVVGVSKESLSNRLVMIETKLDAIDKKIEPGTTRRNVEDLTR